MDSYFAAKAKLFRGEGTSSPAVAILNLDDEFGMKLRDSALESGSEVVGYGLHEATATAEEIVYSATGTRFQLRIGDQTIACKSRLIGEINVYNVLAAASAAYARGCSLEQIK